MEKYIGGDQIHANRGVAEGRYILQNSSETTIYMNVFSAPYRITPGTMKTSQVWLPFGFVRFVLKIDLNTLV